LASRAAPSGNRLRIARIIARLNVGGPAIHVASLTARLPTDRFESALFAGEVSPGETEMVDVLEREGVIPRRIPGLGRALNSRQDLEAFGRLVTELRAFRPHVVHTHTAKAGALGRIAARICRVPIVVHTFHGHVFDGYFNPLVSRAFVAIERLLARGTDAIVTISPRQRDDITLRYKITPRHATYVVPLGFDLARFVTAHARRGELRRELGIGEAPIVSIVGRLTKIKDHPLLFEAMSRVSRGSVGPLPHLRGSVGPLSLPHLCVVGGGEEEPDLRALAVRLGIESRTHFLGFRTDLEHILADTDVLALTSKNEGTPVAVIEALAAGCSVVCTSVGGVPDVLDGGRWGRLVEGRSPAVFAAALEQALAANRSRPAGAADAAREYVLDKYGIDRLVRDHVNMYEELLRRSGLE
jgi:glycosyltransferase involved in cell wall biosynthesis